MSTINLDRIERMRTLLTVALAPTLLEISDESHLHAGHAGAKTGKGHFAIKIAAPSFAGQTSLACHRRIYAALGDLMEHEIHALRIDLVRDTSGSSATRK